MLLEPILWALQQRALYVRLVTIAQTQQLLLRSPVPLVPGPLLELIAAQPAPLEMLARQQTAPSTLCVSLVSTLMVLILPALTVLLVSTAPTLTKLW